MTLFEEYSNDPASENCWGSQNPGETWRTDSDGDEVLNVVWDFPEVVAVFSAHRQYARQRLKRDCIEGARAHQLS